MPDLTVQFDDLPLIHINGMTAATVDGAADIEMRSSPRDWEVVAIRLNGWLPGLRKGAFAAIGQADPWFFEIANAIGVNLALSGAIERGLAGALARPSAYDRARDLREAA
ncbi:hypothetical protein GCM10007874_08950 [Labrys miyagiensis]|uniref:Uncharacterized protein n=1 Tax=Labrys miyagiensis TaxID=346912 RepID=A0ABQ6CGN8_9HYPH|nr:hypothetical protein [Labrys miyagiensis]GLS17879.1 hypothetical protein GCM10007874_08950 [Labrys miyagiensis]